MVGENKNYWPLISSCSIIIFVNVTVFTILNTKLNFPLYAVAVVVPMFFWSTFKFIMDKLKYTSKIEKIWSRFPSLAHKGISFFCLLWSGFLIFKIVIPILKQNYDKNK